MNTSNPAFFRNFNLAAYHWVTHQPVIYSRVKDHMYFMTMNLDGYVTVKLNSFDYKYRTKHITPNMELYCEKFIQQIIQPVLLKSLSISTINGHIFTIMFTGLGPSIIKHVSVEL